VLDQAITAQANREANSPMNPNVSTTTARIRDFTRMNPLKFHGSKLDEDPKEFIDEVYKIVGIMVLSTVEKVELAACQL